MIVMIVSTRTWMASPVDHSERVLLFFCCVWGVWNVCFLGEKDGVWIVREGRWLVTVFVWMFGSGLSRWRMVSIEGSGVCGPYASAPF